MIPDRWTLQCPLFIPCPPPPTHTQMCSKTNTVLPFAATQAPAYRPLPFSVPSAYFAGVRQVLFKGHNSKGGASGPRVWGA